MEQPQIKVPVRCPLCAKEQLQTLPIAATAEALLSGSVLKLWSNCHGQWDATAIERQQIRTYLAVWGEEPATEKSLPCSSVGAN